MFAPGIPTRLFLSLVLLLAAAWPAGGQPDPLAGGLPPTLSVTAAASVTAVASPRRPHRPGFARRGSILDRNGRVLVADTPCWEVSLRYELLAARADPRLAKAQADYLMAVASHRSIQAFGTKGPPERIAEELGGRIAAMWAALGRLTGLDDEELTRRAQRHVAQVTRLKTAVERVHGQGRKLAEEQGFRFLARVDGREAGERLAREFADCTWMRLAPTSARVADNAVALVHVLGQVGKADARVVAADPLRADPERALIEGDPCGISGAERLGDTRLRPWADSAGRAHEGTDVALTIDADLQRRMYAVLEKAVAKSQNPCGGAAVVLDVASGEVLALVSYPGHAYELSLAESQRLLDEPRWTPMRFRAVSSQFPPGSTIKPLTLYTSMAAGAVTTQTRVKCTGRFKQGIPDAFRCWLFNRSGATHGSENGEDALRDSCNIFFFTVGDTLGAEPQIAALGRMGLGVTQGTELMEESAGVLPTSAWLATHRKSAPRYRRADAWNYAFGQGELAVTPLQMANLAATLARGRFEPVTLMKAGGRRIGAAREPGQPLEERWLRTVRMGLWRVVNEKGGTADVARPNTPQAVLCGKTGSAQAVPRALTRRYDFVLAEGRKWSVTSTTREQALAAAPDGARLESQSILESFPAVAEGELPSHAWFIGFTQEPGTPRGARPEGRCYALAVLVEYGGGGGAVAGPIARDLTRCLFPAPKPPRRARPPARGR